jgi:hypothetical protein
MKSENQRSDMVLLNKMDAEEFAKVLVRLVQDDTEIRKAILRVVRASPNIVQRI